jgi:hypothetical protein
MSVHTSLFKMSRCLMFRIKFHKVDETLDLTAQRLQLYKPGAHWSGSFFASDDRQVAVFPWSGHAPISKRRTVFTSFAWIASIIVDVYDARLLPLLSRMSQCTCTSNTAKSFGFDIFASTRKLPLPPCLIIVIVTFVIGRGSSPNATWIGRPTQMAAISAPPVHCKLRWLSVVP